MTFSLGGKWEMDSGKGTPCKQQLSSGDGNERILCDLSPILLIKATNTTFSPIPLRNLKACASMRLLNMYDRKKKTLLPKVIISDT